LVIVLLIFVGLAVLCDDYLVPWLQKIQRVCGMSDDMAGVTLVAFGSAAPELVISTVSVLSNDNKVGVGIIGGSAIIAFGLIPAACFFAVNKPLLLNNWLVCRDVLFYLLGASLLMLYFFIHDGNITIWEALSLVGLYAVYIVVTVFVPCAPAAASESESREAPGGSDESSALLEEANGAADPEKPADGEEKTAPGNKDGDGESSDSCGSVANVVYSTVAAGFTFLFSWTIPAPPDEDSTDSNLDVATVVGTFMTFLYLAALSYGAYYDIVYLCNQTPYLSKEAAGAVLLAAGAQIPDLLASVAMTKAGMPDGAISSAISSQVIVVTLGLGLPWVIYIAYNGGTVNYATSMRTQTTDLTLFLITAGVAVLYLATTVSWRGGESARLTLPKVSIQLAGFVLAYVAFITIEVLHEVGLM
jgi:Ca2+/Na+ antiporter